MIIIASCLRQVKKITAIVKFNYHIDDIMRRSYSERKLSIYAPFNHFYIDKLFQSPFSERKFIFLLLEQGKIQETKAEIYERFFKNALDNLDRIQRFNSIVTILGVAFQIKWQDKKACKLFAEKGFKILKENKDSQEQKTHSYNVCRFLIALKQLVGLAQFPNQHYEAILFEKLKPLFVTYLLQLFWEQNLQKSYPIVKNLITVLKANQDMIPFSDVHHMIKAKKLIKDPNFIEITDSLQKKIRKRLSSNQTGSSNHNKLESEVVQVLFDSYFSDLKKKYL